jgi:hypothetical protein
LAGYYRWIVLIVAIAMLPFIIAKSLFNDAIIMFTVSIGIALPIDIVAMKTGLWNYPRQKFFSKEYFCIVLPAWGIFGVSINLLWPYCGGGVTSLVILTIAMFIFYEIPNIKTISWRYRYSLPLVFIGWFPLVALFRLSFLAI